ncbi:MAG: hypothetical protein M1833_001310 [Piccolia ochrophora]|nr:MAG: hypothetical protein M1833_001310 [Piccolia ochrophora]
MVRISAALRLLEAAAAKPGQRRLESFFGASTKTERTETTNDRLPAPSPALNTTTGKDRESDSPAPSITAIATEYDDCDIDMSVPAETAAAIEDDDDELVMDSLPNGLVTNETLPGDDACVGEVGQLDKKIKLKEVVIMSCYFPKDLTFEVVIDGTEDAIEVRAVNVKQPIRKPLE